MKNREILYDKVTIHSLPEFKELNAQVQKILQSLSWFEKYGKEWLLIIGMLTSFTIGLYLQTSNFLPQIIVGVLISGLGYSSVAQRFGHLAAHGSLTDSKLINKYLAAIFIQFFGAFPSSLGYKEHVKMHHPHTNIIGMGDSSIWKVPQLPCTVYMLIAPLSLPIITPILGALRLIHDKEFSICFRFFIVMVSGFIAQLYILKSYSFHSIGLCLLLIFITRSLLTIPYIHFNIFQHIGLPMYDNNNRPPRIYQMSTGVLNIKYNFFLDLAFGPALIDCHLEHHLFPNVSDSMCRIIRPTVRKFMMKYQLPYQESYYGERFNLFMKDYKRLMMDAPPITHFVGLQ